MSLVKSTSTGENYLQKTTTAADKSAVSAIQAYQKQVGSDGATSNTVFTISSPYVTGSNTLMVFLNGQKIEKVSSASLATEYEETNSTTITVGASLLDGDVIEFIVAGAYLLDTNDFSVIQNGTLTYAADGGSSDTYAITVSPAIDSYVNGMVLNFKANTINTGACTLNVNGNGAIAIKSLNDRDLQNGDIEANQIVTVVYNSTGPKFQMVSQVATDIRSIIWAITFGQ